MQENREPKIRRKQLFFPIIVNSLLIALTAGFIWIMHTEAEEQLKAVTLRENRFLTSEWQLLKTLKARTDQQLQEKEEEIIALRKQYAELKRNGQSGEQLQELEKLLKSAETEREEIISRRMETMSAPAQAAKPEEVPDAARETPPSTNSTLLRRIETLEQEMRELELEHREFRENLSSALQQIREREQTLANSRALRMEDLNTRALLRALITSPRIRSEYPGLLDSADRFFSNYGLQERLSGRREAYAELESILEEIAED
jgi:5-bromo-4-chloroindolyl phosphate hydrolysis protein